MLVSCRIGVILGVRSIGDDEDLYVLIQSTAGPEALPLVPVDLIERFPDGDASPVELYMDQGKAVDKDGYIVAIGSCPLSMFVLIEDLDRVVVDVVLVDEANVEGGAIISDEVLDMVGLYLLGLLDHPLILVGKDSIEEGFPLTVREFVFVDNLKLLSQALDKVLFIADGEVFIPLFSKSMEEGSLQARFALVISGAIRLGDILGHNSGFIGGKHKIVRSHPQLSFLLKVSSLSL